MAVWTPASASWRKRPMWSSTVAGTDAGRELLGVGALRPHGVEHGGQVAAVAPDDGARQVGDGDRGRVAVDRLAVIVQHLDLVADGVGVAEQVARVGVLGDEPQACASRPSRRSLSARAPGAGVGSTSPRAPSRPCRRRPVSPCPTSGAEVAARPRAARSARPAAGTPSRRRRCSRSNHAAPMPQMARPPDNTSSVATIFPRWATLR